MQKAIAPNPTILNLTSSCPETPRLSVMHIKGKESKQSSRPHAHNFFELFFVEDGEGWYRMGDRQIRAKAGDLFALSPGETHDPSGLDNANKWIIAFGADALNPARTDADLFLMPPNELFLLSLFKDRDFSSKHLHIPLENRQRWLTQVQQLKMELENKYLGFTEAARALLILLLIDTTRLAEPQLKKSPVEQSPLLTKVFSFIETQYCNPISLHEVAKAVNLSPAYLTDLVRRETGRTVNRWIVEHRIARARTLLLESDRSIAEIAETVGYLDAGHFIRLFRRVNGTTPQAWRLLQRN